MLLSIRLPPSCYTQADDSYEGSYSMFSFPFLFSCVSQNLDELTIRNVNDTSKGRCYREPKKRENQVTEEDSIITSNGTTTKKLSETLKLKERYQEGIKSASNVIIAVIIRGGECNELVLETIIASLLCGIPTVAKSVRGRKALKKSSDYDRAFAKMAFIAASKTKELGSGKEKMYYAAASILSCHGQKKYRNLNIPEYQMYELAERVAKNTKMY